MADERSALCEMLQPQLAAYALGEPPDDRLRAHLAACDACRRDLAAYADVARALSYAAPEATPPAALRQRILDAASATNSVTQRRHARGGAARWNWSRLRWGLTFATLLAFLLWNLSLQRQLNARDAQLATSRENWQIVTRLLNDPAVRPVALHGERASGTLWTVPDESLACLMIEELPNPGADRVYQIWLLRAGTIVSAGTFVPQGRETWVIVRADQPLSAFESLGITIEPRGGSAMPTGPRVLQGSIDSSTASSSRRAVAHAVSH